MIFERLRLIDDPFAGSGAWNMAVDEALLRSAALPALRVYRWQEPTVSFGYFEKIAVVRFLHPATALVRRWTGGGMVNHADDFTFSLIVPAAHALAGSERIESYGAIHRAVRESLRECCGITAEFATENGPCGGGCFSSPVVNDLLFAQAKITGGAQRRTRHGLLHQGSIQNVSLALNFAGELARNLAGRVERSMLDHTERAAAQRLVASRYGLATWLERF